MDTLKLNCGALIRDCDGDLVLTGRGRINHLLSPFHAELIACLQGIQLAVNLGTDCIIVETDTQEVVKAIKSNSYDGSAVGHLIDEIKSLLTSNFLCFECAFIGRKCNRAVHELAALGYLCNEGEELITQLYA
jgi:hypothetical protein